jgi:hypothetical protein
MDCKSCRTENQKYCLDRESGWQKLCEELFLNKETLFKDPEKWNSNNLDKMKKGKNGIDEQTVWKWENNRHPVHVDKIFYDSDNTVFLFEFKLYEALAISQCGYVLTTHNLFEKILHKKAISYLVFPVFPKLMNRVELVDPQNDSISPISLEDFTKKFIEKTGIGLIRLKLIGKEGAYELKISVEGENQLLSKFINPFKISKVLENKIKCEKHFMLDKFLFIQE